MEKIKKQLLDLHKNGIYKSPLTNYFTINYPTRPIFNKATNNDRNKIFEYFKKVDYQNKKQIPLIYIHLPFCSRKCSFCHYYTVRCSRSFNMEKEYVDCLLRQIEMFSQKTKIKIPKAILFIGGGTPSLMPVEWIANIVNKIKTKLGVEKFIEATLEIHPEIIKNGSDFVEDYLQKIKKIGIGRLSLGFQSSSENILRSTARGHSTQDSLSVYQLIKKNNFRLNLDLLWGGLPCNTLKSLEKSLVEAFSLKPHAITTYEVCLRPDTPDYYAYLKNNDFEKNSLQFAKERLLIQKIAKQFGYHNVHGDWFQKDVPMGYQQSKWLLPYSMLIGFGSGTYSYAVPDMVKHLDLGLQFFSPCDNEKYTKMIKNGEYPVDRIYWLKQEDCVRWRLIMIMKHTGGKGFKLSWLNDILKNAKAPNREHINKRFNQLLNKGFIKEEPKGVINYTTLGDIFQDEVAATFASQEMLNKMARIKADKELRYHFFVEPNFVMKFIKFLKK